MYCNLDSEDKIRSPFSIGQDILRPLQPQTTETISSVRALEPSGIRRVAVIDSSYTAHILRTAWRSVARLMRLINPSMRLHPETIGYFCYLRRL